MARTLPPAISNAIPFDQTGGAQPSVQIGAQDLQRRMYQQEVMFTQARTACLITSAGTLLRAAIFNAANDPNPVWLYRITSMATLAQWIAAGQQLYTNGDSRAGVALVQTGATIRLFLVDHTAQSVYSLDSTDDGVTWSAAVLVKIKPTISGSTYLVCTGLAAQSTTELQGAWYIYAQAASAVCEITYSGGWSAWAYKGPSNNAVGQIRGWTCDPTQATIVYASGLQFRQGLSGIACASATFAAGVYSNWSTVHPMDTATNGLSLAYAAVHWDPGTSKWWLAVNLADTGAVTGTADNCALIFASVDGQNWTLVQMLYGNMLNEVHVFFSAGIAYVFDNQFLYTAPASAAQTGMETDLLKMTIVEKIGVPQQFTLVFSNNAGQWNNQPYLRDNAQMYIYMGYNGTTIQTHTCYMDAIEYVKAGDTMTMTVHGRCIQKELDQVILLYSAYTSASMATVITGLIGAQIPLVALPGAAQFSQILASFAVVPGQTRAQALKRLSDVYQFDMFTSTPEGIKIIERSASDTSTWTYYQEHLGIAFQFNADQPNVVRVLGAPPAGVTTNIFAEAIDHTAVNLAGVHRYRHIVDRLLDTAAKCQIKANLALRDDQTQVNTAAMTVTINPQHELCDVISVNDADLGLANQRLRIKEIATYVDWQNGQWEQHLALDLP